MVISILPELWALVFKYIHSLHLQDVNKEFRTRYLPEDDCSYCSQPHCTRIFERLSTYSTDIPGYLRFNWRHLGRIESWKHLGIFCAIPYKRAVLPPRY